MADSTSVPQPRDMEPVLAAERAAARISNSDRPFGTPGPPVNRRSPFYIGLTATLGASIAVAAAYLVVVAANTIVLVGLAFFIGMGLQPPVRHLTDRRVPRPAAVTAVVVGILALIAGFAWATITPLIDEGDRLLGYLRDRTSLVGQLNERYHLVDHLRTLLGGSGGMVETSTAVLVVLVLSIYFLADMPRIRRTLYRLAPATRRPRVILLGDQVFDKVANYLLGNVLISLIAGGVTLVWLLVFGVPYALLLSIMVAVLDLVPVVGSVIAGATVALMAFTVSPTVCVATVCFFLAYKLVEDYVLLPKIIGRAVAIPAVVTVVAVLLGGVLLGVAGALVAIPIAAAALLVLREVCIPRLDEK
jgi:predicted PurR-regulated permease PerM